jgi:hypothetical protein
MKLINKNEKVRVTSSLYSDVRERYTSDFTETITVELWEGEDHEFPTAAVVGITAPEGHVYCRQGWEDIFNMAKKAIVENKFPEFYIDKNRGQMDSISSLMEALDKGKTIEKWVSEMAHYYEEFEPFKVIPTETVVEIVGIYPTCAMVRVNSGERVYTGSIEVKVGDTLSLVKGVWVLR